MPFSTFSFAALYNLLRAWKPPLAAFMIFFLRAWCGTPLSTRGMGGSSLGLQQPVHAPEIGGAHQRGFAELVLPLARLLGQNVPLVRAAPLELAAPGAGEALHGGAFRLHLGHTEFLVSYQLSAIRTATQLSLIADSR